MGETGGGEVLVATSKVEAITRKWFWTFSHSGDLLDTDNKR